MNYFIFRSSFLTLILFIVGVSLAHAAPRPLRHPSLNTDIPLPNYVYRVDSRSPDDIFRNGFTARGLDASITQYVIGGGFLTSATYISTTESRETAADIASSQVNDTYRNQWSCDSTGRIQCRTWIYRITPQITNFFSIHDNLPRTPQFDRYRGQLEWAAVDRIYTDHIESAMPVTRFFNNGIPDGPAIFNEGRTRENENYNANTEGYLPMGFEHVDVGPTAQCDSCSP